MKILFISPSYYPATYYGGPIISLYSLTQCLAKIGIKVFVSSTNCNGKKKLDVVTNRYIQLNENLFTKYYSGGSESGFSVRMYLSLWKDFIGKDIIYLVSVFSPPTPLVIFLNYFFRKPMILSARGQLGEWCLNQGNIFKKLWLKIFISPVANKITWEATSLSEKEMITKVYPKARVEVIPPIINVEEFEVKQFKVDEVEVQGSKVNGFKVQSAKKDYAIYEKLTGKSFSDKKIIVSMGRLHKVKGFDILIEAVELVRSSKLEVEKEMQSQDVVLLIAGEDFGEKQKLDWMIDKLGLNEKVFLVGKIEGSEKIEFLRNADLFALASHHENFGIVYAEALASGIPVIASSKTPWEEVEKYNCGKWVNNTPSDFADAIIKIFNFDLTQMGMNGQKYVHEHFTCDNVINKYQAMFNSILN